MKTEAELEEYKHQWDKKLLKKARLQATVFGVLAVTALISIVFAFFQRAAAEKQRQELLIARTQIEQLISEAKEASQALEKCQSEKNTIQPIK